jgi:non-ribosomal peptide synthetase component F
VLVAAFGNLLCGLTSQEEVVIITAFQNRTREEFETVVGQLANSVPLRLRRRPQEDIADTNKRTSRQLWAVADHQELPLPVILEALKIHELPGAAQFPLAWFALHPRTEQQLDMPGLRVEATDFAIPAARADFGVLVVPEARGLKVWAESASYLGTETVRGWLERYVELLRTFADCPTALAGDW